MTEDASDLWDGVFVLSIGAVGGADDSFDFDEGYIDGTGDVLFFFESVDLGEVGRCPVGAFVDEDAFFFLYFSPDAGCYGFFGQSQLACGQVDTAISGYGSVCFVNQDWLFFHILFY